MTDRGEVDEHEIRFVLGRVEWARTEWPAVLVWGGWAAVLLLGIALAVTRSPWWAFLLLAWWPLGGAKATGILGFLLRSTHRIGLRVQADGAIFASENDSEPVYCHWVGFQDCGRTFLLWGGDGRYRLIIPKRALTSADYLALRERVGVDLANLGPGQEARIQKST